MSVHHLPCPKCGSKNNLAVWEDGSQKCFTPNCNYQVYSNSTNPFPMTSTNPLDIQPVIGEYVDIPRRNLKAATCKKAGYIKGKHGGEDAYFWPIYSKDRVLVGYKVRKANKVFLQIGKNIDNRFLGQELWGGNSKLLVVFEGEKDCLSYMQTRDGWPCVSLPNGAESGQKTIKEQLSWLLTFETVILCYDNDEVGQKAAARDIQLLPPRKGKIGFIEGYKDASEALQAGDTKAITGMVFNAKEYEPDGIVNANKLKASILEDPKVDSVSYGYECLDKRLLGLRKGELCTITGGTGTGKSTFVNEIAYNLAVKQNQTIASINLEENNLRTARRFVGIHLNRPIHIDRGELTDEQISTAFDQTLGTNRVYLYDSFGSIDPTVLLNRIRHCVISLNCDWVIFDHLSILVSGMDQGSDERRAIDYTVTQLRSFVEETGCGMILVSHLRRPQGNKGYEDGEQTRLSSFRGSQSIPQLSDICLSLERDQQAADSGCKVRVLKNRFSGWLGVCGQVKYDEATGRMLEVPEEQSNGYATPDF